jgi:hypothetical protein
LSYGRSFDRERCGPSAAPGPFSAAPHCRLDCDGDQWRSVACRSDRADVYRLAVLLARQMGRRFIRVLPTTLEDLLDVVGRPYDGVDHVVMDDVHETVFDPGKSDYPLVPVGMVAQTPCDVIANLTCISGWLRST